VRKLLSPTLIDDAAIPQEQQVPRPAFGRVRNDKKDKAKKQTFAHAVNPVPRSPVFPTAIY